jgi:hypothetical protein
MMQAGMMREGTTTMTDALTISEDGRDVSVALGAAPAGRLTFPHGAPLLTIKAVSDLDAMLRERFEGSPPKASLDAESIVSGIRGSVVRSSGGPGEATSCARRRFLGDRDPGEAANCDADLRGLELLGLRIGGGASQVEISLPPPIGAVAVAIGGGVSHVTVTPI